MSQVPDEAAPLVRALLAADRNQHYRRLHMSEDGARRRPRWSIIGPFIIADADTGHGGDAHVRNLIRRFVEVGVPGYHIEDQKPGVKKCGHQAGKVLVQVDEQIKRLNAARLQLDIMQVPGIIVARTDAEAATYLDGRGDERDQRFILGATNTGIPNYKTAFLAIMRRFHAKGVEEINGHLMYRISEARLRRGRPVAGATGWPPRSTPRSRRFPAGRSPADISRALDQATTRLLDLWQMEASLKTYGQAVADVMAFHLDEGAELPMTVERVARLRGESLLCRGAGQGPRDGLQHYLELRHRPDPGRLLPDPGRDRLRHCQVAGGGALCRYPLDGDQDRQSARRTGFSPRRSMPSIPTRCLPTTSRPPSTGTPPA